MRLAGRPRHEPPPSNTAQLSLFPGLPPSVRVQTAIRLTEANVARTVPPGRAGVFFLKSVGGDGQIAERMGRDDLDLRRTHSRAILTASIAPAESRAAPRRT